MAKNSVQAAQDAAMCKGNDPNKLTAPQMGISEPIARVSMGDRGADKVKTTGIKMRGAGAATKGVMSRGPMA
jgi:hypothetical protein